MTIPNNIDAIIAERLGNDTFVKAQLEKNFSDEAINTYLKAIIQVRSEKIIANKVHEFLSAHLQEAVKKIVCDFNAAKKLEKMIKTKTDLIYNEEWLDAIVQEIMENDFYEDCQGMLICYFKNILAEKLGIEIE